MENTPPVPDVVDVDALCKSARENHFAVLERQLEDYGDGALLLQSARNGHTTLIAAARRRSASRSHVKIVKLLWTRSGLEVRRMTDTMGRTALHYLAARVKGRRAARDIASVLVLSEDDIRQEEVMARDKEGNTVLHFLAFLKTEIPDSLESFDPVTAFALMTRFFIERAPEGALGSQNLKGETPLHLAAQRRKFQIVRELIEKASVEDMLVVDNKGHSFVYYLLNQECEHVLRSLARCLPLGVFEGLSEKEASIHWYSYIWRRHSFLQVCATERIEGAERLIRNLSTDSFARDNPASMQWAAGVMHPLLAAGHFEIAERVLTLAGVGCLQPYNASGCSTPNGVEAIIGCLRLNLSKESVRAAVRMIEQAPAEYFESDGFEHRLFVKAIASQYLTIEIVAAIARRTAYSAEDFEADRCMIFSEQSRTNIAAVLPCFSKDLLTSDLLLHILKPSHYLTESAGEEVISFFLQRPLQLRLRMEALYSWLCYPTSSFPRHLQFVAYSKRRQPYALCPTPWARLPCSW